MSLLITERVMHEVRMVRDPEFITSSAQQVAEPGWRQFLVTGISGF